MLCQLNEINDHLYISSANSVTPASLAKDGITCVINCSLFVPAYPTDHLRYIPITVQDNERASISVFFDFVSNVINEEHQAGGKTLVYCVAGISRSATFCIAYLMKYRNMTLRDAFRHVRSKRRIIRPNNGFFRQLIDFERRLYGETTIEMVLVPNADTPDCYVPDVFYEVCRGIVWLKSCKKNFSK